MPPTETRRPVVTAPPAVRVTLILDHDRAWALAQLCKRIGWSEMRSNAVDDAEAYVMRDAVNNLRSALARDGVNPR